MVAVSFLVEEMTMSIGAISGSYGVDPYEPYRSMYAGKMDAADAAEMAEAVDFDDEMNNVAGVNGVEPVRREEAPVARVEPTIEADQLRPDAMRSMHTTAMEDLMELSRSMMGFHMLEIPTATL